ncbi:tetratricopeptide repeat protein [Desulfobacterales bacterium HSG2]|nr:tetratricopeptide repeat protein [Desulfobacterales bacterium HSG2]
MKFRQTNLLILIASFILTSNYAFAETSREFFEKGSGFLREGNNDLAIESFTNALKLGIKDDYHQAVTYYGRGLAYSKKGETEKAILDYSKTIELHRNYPDAYLNRGNEYLLKGDYEKAIDDFTQNIIMKPDSVFAYNSRALAYSNLKKYDSAISDLNIAIKLKNDYYKAHRNRAKIYYDMGKTEMAMRDIATALEINSHDIGSYKLRSEIRYERQQYEMALSDLSVALKFNPEQYEYYNDAAWIMATCPNKDVRNAKKAILLSEQAVKICKNPTTMDTLSAAYAENGNFAEAVKTVEIAITLIKKDSDPEILSKLKKHLESYKAGIPWREN